VRLAAETELALEFLEMGQADRADLWMRAAEATLQRTGDRGEPRASWLYASGRLLTRHGKRVEAVDRLRDALETARRAGAGAFEVDRIVGHLAGALALLARYDEAARLLDEHDEELVRAAGPDHPFRIGVIATRGGVAGAANDARGELAYSREAIALALRVGPDAPSLAGAYNNVCDALVRLGRYEEALDECAKAVVEGERIEGSRGSAATNPRMTTAEAMLGLRRYADAVAAYRNAIDHLDADNDKRALAAAMGGLGTAFLGDGKPQLAIDPLEHALAVTGELQGSAAQSEQYRAQASFALAQALWMTGTRGPRVAALATAGAEAFRRAGDDGRAGEAERWLAAHR
jgi:tetratricopeptide (TPR) repeat protein